MLRIQQNWAAGLQRHVRAAHAVMHHPTHIPWCFMRASSARNEDGQQWKPNVSSPASHPKRTGISAQRETSIVGTEVAQEAKDVLLRLYDAYNARDVDKIAQLIAEDCSYHDLAVYQDAFEGKQAVVEYFAKVMDIFPAGFKFVVDDITSGDPKKVGVMWHVELDGDVFPFTRGCSFYTVNPAGLISQARDLVEPPFKSGAGALEGLKLISPIIKALAPSKRANLPLESYAIWAFYAAYSSLVLFSNIPPGQSAFSTPPESLQDVFNMSLNFYFVNIGLSQLGLTPFPSPVTHPVYEGLFNFVCAWGMLFLPVILTDKKCQKISNKVPWWLGIMFITNVFFIPFLAIRAAPEPESLHSESQLSNPPTTLPWAPALGWGGLGLGLFCIGWLFAGRSEFGDVAARWGYFIHMFNSDRVFWAFFVDMLLYSVWQSEMLKEVEARYRLVPFFGLAGWLISGCPRLTDQAPGGQLPANVQKQT